MNRTGKRVFLILICLTLLNGCTVRIAYAVLDNILGWQLGQYVSLKGEQKALSKKTFKRFHSWHRQTQLPLYIDYLKTLKQGMIGGNISGQYLHAESDKLQELMDLSIAKLAPGLTEIAQSLNEEQIQEIVKALDEEREEYRKDYIEDSDEKVQKRRIRDITRYIGGFFGSFTEDQKQTLKNWEESLTPHEELMLDQQLTWQADFLHAMSLRTNASLLEEKIHSLMLFRTDNWNPELQKVLDVNQDLTFSMLAKLFNSQTPKQKKKLEKKFDQYINDLSILARKAGKSQISNTQTKEHLKKQYASH